MCIRDSPCNILRDAYKFSIVPGGIKPQNIITRISLNGMWNVIAGKNIRSVPICQLFIDPRNLLGLTAIRQNKLIPVFILGKLKIAVSYYIFHIVRAIERRHFSD